MKYILITCVVFLLLIWVWRERTFKLRGDWMPDPPDDCPGEGDETKTTHGV